MFVYFREGDRLFGKSSKAEYIRIQIRIKEAIKEKWNVFNNIKHLYLNRSKITMTKIKMLINREYALNNIQPQKG